MRSLGGPPLRAPLVSYQCWELVPSMYLIPIPLPICLIPIPPSVSFPYLSQYVLSHTSPPSLIPIPLLVYVHVRYTSHLIVGCMIVFFLWPLQVAGWWKTADSPGCPRGHCHHHKVSVSLRFSVWLVSKWSGYTLCYLWSGVPIYIFIGLKYSRIILTSCCVSFMQW